MRKKLDIGAVLALMICTAAITFVITHAVITERYNRDLEDSYRLTNELAKFIEAKNYIENSYVGSWDEEKLLDGATRGLVESLDDRWSSYLSVDDFQFYSGSDSNSYVGIGVMYAYHEETGGIQVTEVYPDLPASRAGMKPMDIIVGVDGAAVSSMDYLIAAELIRGVANTMVTLDVYRPSADETLQYEILRSSVRIDAVRATLLENDIGLIRIRNFDTGADIDFAECIENLTAAGVKGLVFDVRSNPGGKLNVMLPMLDILLPEGRLITLREKSGKEDAYESGPDEIRMPMAVVINEHSYSAAEFFAAALKEYDKAVLVGQSTTGKGYSQVNIPLSDGSGLILSTSEYFTPNGKSLADEGGLMPDYPVELTGDQAASVNTLQPLDDPQIARAVQVVGWSLTPVVFD
ncbi:MAG: S41 family peptidase [Oscillospiraceae bacterium]|nr:S41 family peptidase [Oscillospiraceae bacterium]